MSRAEMPYSIEKEAENLREFALIMLKPFGMHKKTNGKIKDILFRQGNVLYNQDVTTSEEKMAEHYLPSQFDKNGNPNSYYPVIVRYMSEKEVEIFIIEDCKDTKSKDTKSFAARLKEDIIGNTKPDRAKEGTIRRIALEDNFPYIQFPEIDSNKIIDGVNYCTDNLIHCSDSLESSLREIKIWYKDQPEVIKKYEEIYNKLKSAKS